MFRDLWETPKEEEPTFEEVIRAMEYNIKEKEKLIEKLAEELAQKDKVIEELEREIEMVSSGIVGC